MAMKRNTTQSRDGCCSDAAQPKVKGILSQIYSGFSPILQTTGTINISHYTSHCLIYVFLMRYAVKEIEKSYIFSYQFALADPVPLSH